MKTTLIIITAIVALLAANAATAQRETGFAAPNTAVSPYPSVRDLYDDCKRTIPKAENSSDYAGFLSSKCGAYFSGYNLGAFSAYTKVLAESRKPENESAKSFVLALPKSGSFPLCKNLMDSTSVPPFEFVLAQNFIKQIDGIASETSRSKILAARGPGFVQIYAEKSLTCNQR